MRKLQGTLLKKRKGGFHLFWAALVLVLASGWRVVAGGQAFQSSAGAAAQQPAQILRKRADEFYGLLHARQVAKAELYTTKASRERLRDQTRNPFLGYKITSVQIDPDGQNAAVVVELTVIAAFLGGPIPMQRNTKWVVEDGEWRIVVPEPPPTPTLDAMMGIGPTVAAKPEELKFGGHSFELGMMRQGQKKEALFPFSNISDHAVTIAQVATGCDCLQVKPQKLEYNPGESGELVIEFDSSNYERDYSQTIVVLTNPGEVRYYLRIHAVVEPPERLAPASQR